MNTELKDKTLVCYPEGHIDSENAPRMEAELERIRAEVPHDKLEINLKKLSYISSAGLRVLLRTKKSETNLAVTDVPPEVYEILFSTGFTQMMEVKKAYRELDLSGAEVIGRGAKGTVYRYNPELIVKVYHNPESLDDIIRERENARRAFVMDIPTAISYDIVKVDGKFASVFELLDCDSFSDILKKHPEELDAVACDFARLLRKIHETKVSADEFPDSVKTVKKWLTGASKYLDGRTYAKYEELISRFPQKDNLLHGDYHTNNVMLQNNEALLIDMDTLSYGDPIIELANIYVTYVGFGLADPTVVENFLGIPYDTSMLFWEKMLPCYLETEDEETLSRAALKIEALGLLRVLRHVEHRGHGTEKDAELVEIAKQMIAERIDRIDSFEL